MYNPIIQNLTDSAAYETLAKENPTLLAAVERCLLEGESAKKIERRMMKRYGRNNLIALLVSGAAHHIEKQK